jgi:hypothetical protein
MCYMLKCAIFLTLHHVFILYFDVTKMKQCLEITYFVVAHL